MPDTVDCHSFPKELEDSAESSDEKLPISSKKRPRVLSVSTPTMKRVRGNAAVPFSIIDTLRDESRRRMMIQNLRPA